MYDLGLANFMWVLTNLQLQLAWRYDLLKKSSQFSEAYLLGKEAKENGLLDELHQVYQ